MPITASALSSSVVILMLVAAAPAWSAPNEHTLRLTTPRGEVIEVIEHHPAGPAPFPAVVLGSGMGYHMRQPVLERVARALAAEGVAVFRFDWAYRVRNGPSGKPSTDRLAEIEDMNAVIARARKTPWVDAERLVVGGKSLGSIIAWRVLRADAALKGAVLLTPVCTPKPDDPKTPGGNYPDVAREERRTAWILGDADPVCATNALYDQLASAKGNPRVIVVRGGHGYEVQSPAAASPPPQIDAVTLNLVTLATNDFVAALVGRPGAGGGGTKPKAP